MSNPTAPNIALYFDPDGYVEPVRASGQLGAAVGLMGRHVAGKEFLDAYLTHGRWDSLAAVVRARDRAEPLLELCRRHPSSRDKRRRLQIIEESELPTRIASSARPADVFHLPNPPDAKFAWMRHSTAPASFALCCITHTLCSQAGVNALCDLVTAPFEPFDALICTSQAVVEMVKAVTGSFADYLRDRFGGTPALRPRLELIPLGVNLDRFHPPTSEARAKARAQLATIDEEVLVLCVGRLSHHAKAHPYPVFHAAQQAAHRSGRKVHLVFAGWAANPTVAQEYRSAARYFAPGTRVSFVDGQNPTVRAAVWPAADVFISLPDNIQETFGLVIVEAMASGLPVIGSDWDGYRDLIVSGETGFLVPTRMVRGATSTITARLLFGQVNYDHFLAESCQATAVDANAAAEALTRLVADADLRKQMGAAGRKRAVEHFGWERVIRAYESLWTEQQRELAQHRGTAPAERGPVRYPAPEYSFAGYPSDWLTNDTRVQAAPDATPRLAALLAMPLTNLAASRRCSDHATLMALLREAATPRRIGELAELLQKDGTDPEPAHATIAWLLKYGLLAPVESSQPVPGASS